MDIRAQIHGSGNEAERATENPNENKDIEATEDKATPKWITPPSTMTITADEFLAQLQFVIAECQKRKSNCCKKSNRTQHRMEIPFFVKSQRGNVYTVHNISNTGH